MNRRELQATGRRESDRDDEVDALFDIVLSGVSFRSELSGADLKILLRMLPEDFNLDELQEIIENRIALRNAVANGIGKTSVDREVA